MEMLERVDRYESGRKRRRLSWHAEASREQMEVQAEDEQFGRKHSGRSRHLSQHSGRSRHLSPPRRNDDREGHYVFMLGENLTPRYKILRKMGEGTFGQVLECWDRELRECFAIKVIRSIRKYRDAAMIEVDVLQLLARNDRGNSHCVQIQDWFDYRNHICIVFEKLGPSLYDFLRRNCYCPVPVDLVREFARQLLESVEYMHDLRLVHTDLKPENVLLKYSECVKIPNNKRFSDEMNFRYLPKSCAIKLIDFGSTVSGSRTHTSIASTRQYRAPEVILGLGWTYPCDMWSIGCIIVELCLGKVLFKTHDNLEHLAMMERVLGPLPKHMIQRASEDAKMFFKRSQLNWPEGAVSSASLRAVRKLDRLEIFVTQHVGCSRSSSLIDLLYRLLEFDPLKRLTAQDALHHPFFMDRYLT